MALTNNAKPLDGKKFPFKAAFDALPNSINELLCEIDDIEDQISLMGNEDNEVSATVYNSMIRRKCFLIEL